MTAIVPSNTASPGWRASFAADAALRKLIGHSIKLPSVPALYYQVVTELESPRGSIDFVARLVAKDPAISARILQTVNSAAFAPSQPITSPHEAVLFLGAESVKAVILFEETLAPLRNTVCLGFSLSELWRHSLSVGGMAVKIAHLEKVDAAIANTSFTAGLLHDLGKLLFLGNMPTQYATAVALAARENVSLKTAEEEVFGVNHADLGALLMTSWGLPQTLIDAIGWHHQPSLSGEHTFSLLSGVHVANVIDHELRRGSAHTKCTPVDLDHIAAIGLDARYKQWRAALGCPVKGGPVKI